MKLDFLQLWLFYFYRSGYDLTNLNSLLHTFELCFDSLNFTFNAFQFFFKVFLALKNDQILNYFYYQPTTIFNIWQVYLDALNDALDRLYFVHFWRWDSFRALNLIRWVSVQGSQILLKAIFSALQVGCSELQLRQPWDIFSIWSFKLEVKISFLSLRQILEIHFYYLRKLSDLVVDSIDNYKDLTYRIQVQFEEMLLIRTNFDNFAFKILQRQLEQGGAVIFLGLVKHRIYLLKLILAFVATGLHRLVVLHVLLDSIDPIFDPLKKLFPNTSRLASQFFETLGPGQCATVADFQANGIDLMTEDLVALQ